MKHSQLIFTFLFICLAHPVFAQKISFYNVVSFTENKNTVKAYIRLEKPKKYKPNKNLTYYYFYKNTIHHTQGGYMGSLLHGSIEITNQAQQLIERGNYKNGIKNGRWIRWHPTGTISEISHWKKGQLQGLFESYDTNGLLQLQSNYKKGKLHGKQITFTKGKMINQVRYRKGSIEEKKKESPKIGKEKKKKKEKQKKGKKDTKN